MNNAEVQTNDRVLPATTSALAITALVVGVVSLCVGPLGLIAIILGVVSLIAIAKPQKRLSGRVMAIAGIVLGVIGPMLMVLVIIAMIPALQQARLAARGIEDMTNLHQIGMAMYVYADDNDDVFPAHVGEVVIGGYVPDATIFQSPFNPQGQIPVYVPGPAPQSPYRFGGYVFIPITQPMNKIASPRTTIVAYTAKVIPQQTSRNVWFLDGHAENFDEQSFRAMIGPDVDVDALDQAAP